MKNSNQSNAELLNVFKNVLKECKSEQDHRWKQTGLPRQTGHYQYGDMYGHPEDRPAIWIPETEVTFKCEICGKEKVLKQK